MKNRGRSLISHYESCFVTHGDTPQGVDWPNAKDADVRYAVMFELFQTAKNTEISILDYGCGLGHFLEFLNSRGLAQNLIYTGADGSELFVDACRKKFPNRDFLLVNVLENNESLKDSQFDYIILNGVLTEKRDLSQEQMTSHLKEILMKLFPLCRKGIAFNVMSTIVDWQREDLFHLDFTTVTNLISTYCSRHFHIRHDYGLREYTIYVFKEPTSSSLTSGI